MKWRMVLGLMAMLVWLPAARAQEASTAGGDATISPAEKAGALSENASTREKNASTQAGSATTRAAADKIAATRPTVDDGSLYMLSDAQVDLEKHHTRHLEMFSRDMKGFNLAVLRGIDIVQSHAMDGGGYFIGVKAKPAESPIGYALKLFGNPLLDPPRTSSYCSGSTYAAFIEGMNVLRPDGGELINAERVEALRMQEPDGGRREDGVKFWGHWNDDGPGSQYALVQYSSMGADLLPKRARPGDFCNISWKNGGGHSVIFLGWDVDKDGVKWMRYWASQPGTNGLGDQMSRIDKMQSVVFVRLVAPNKIFSFDPTTKVNRKVEGVVLDF